MDLNDPRRRLAIAQANSPSIRVTVAPPPQPGKVTIAGPPKPVNFSVAPAPAGSPQQQPSPQVHQAPQFHFDFNKGVESLARAPGEITSGVAGTLSEIGRNSILGINDLGTSVSKFLYGNPALNKKLEEDRAVRQQAVNQFFPQQQSQDVKTAGELGAYIAPIGVGNKIKGAVEATKGVQSLLQGGKLAQLAGKILPAGAESASSSLVASGMFKDPNKSAGQQLAENVGIDAAAQTGLGLFGKVASKVRGALSGRSAGIVKDIAKTNDPAAIQKVLGVDDQVASFLANESDPSTIKEVLKTLQVDPNLQISDSVRARLEAEGITHVKQEDTPYGASYNNNEISLKDQSYATNDNLYHELGHHIYRTKLTPEERAMFDGINGSASKQAAGRPGYTQADFSSEDFSDFLRKAMDGKINEVPESVRPIIQKYAGVAADEAPAIAAKVIPTSKTEVVQVVNHQTGKKTFYRMPQANRDQIIKSIDGTGKSSIAGESLDGEVTHITARSPEWMAKNGFEDGGVYGATKAAVTEKQVDHGIAKTQTGVADAPIDASAKTASPDAPDSGFITKADTNANSGQNAIETPQNASQSITPQSVEDFAPNADPESKKAIQDVLDSLKGAQTSYDNVAKIRSGERAAKIGKGEGSFDAAGGGETGFQAKLGSLRGQLSKSKFQTVDVDPKVSDQILNIIERSDLPGYEKLNTQNALRKVWGASDKRPTPSDIVYIRKFFNKEAGAGVGDEVAAGIEQALKDGRTWTDVAADIAGLPRALMATGDLSGAFRQAAPLGSSNPKEWAKATALSVKWAFNPKAYEKAMREIADDPSYSTIADEMGVDLTGIGAMQDEAFIGAGIAEKIPLGVGKIVQGADRAYTGVLTKLRYDVAKKAVDAAGGPEEYRAAMKEMYGDNAQQAARKYGEVINTLTGRGGKRDGLLDQHMKTLSTILFAPRLWAANLQRLNPAWYAMAYKENPDAAKLALKSAATFYTMVGTILGTAAVAGAEVGMDPRSADFGKIKVGNTRYDILGGQQQNIVQAWRQITGEKVNSETGAVDTLGDNFGDKTRLDLAFDMFQSKSNPLLGFAMNLLQLDPKSNTENPLTFKDRYGNDYNIADKAARLAIPLGLQGAFDTSQDVGSLVKGAALNAPSFLGVGVQTYGNQKTKDKTAPQSLEAKATADDKAASDARKAFVESQSKEDQALMKLSDAQLKQYQKDGTIDQAKYDHIQNLQKGAETHGKPIPVPDGANTDASKTFYKKWNSMDDKDQKAWLKQPADDNAKEIATQLNGMRSKGLSEFKPSNELTKAYSEYEKDLNTHPEYTTVDKRNKAKAFQTYAYKLNYSTDQRDIYAEGSSSDLKTLLHNGDVKLSDLEQAINMDNELFNSGLTGSLKFTKKFRNEYGYAVPSGGSGGSSGSGGDSKNAHLSNLLVKTATKGTSGVPTFSKTPTATKLSFKNVNTPKKSGKRISINL